ncbi:cupin domain-containing protein [Pseudoroseicyclus sp. CXY001]|uniref:(R)-mandelonitrile lyase n=1 Tax=Pseudoroseicyclus sp. CXY001 TaxID=3242492 RepID=UPI0035714488
MKIIRAGSEPAKSGPPDWFTGTVWMEWLAEAEGPARATFLNVTFGPGARTFWHTHPLGQTILITAGIGRVQRRGGPVEEIRAGDTVWFPPGEEHWHGAAPDQPMTHIAVQEEKDGETVFWLEEVSSADYAP